MILRAYFQTGFLIAIFFWFKIVCDYFKFRKTFIFPPKGYYDIVFFFLISAFFGLVVALIWPILPLISGQKAPWMNLK